VLVIGCGLIGLGAVIGAVARGARVLALDLAADKVALAEGYGAQGLDGAAPGIAERIRDLIGGDGPTVVIEAVGAPATYQQALELVAFAGRVVCIGYAKQAVALDTSLIVRKELDLRGARNALPEDFAAVLAALRGGLDPRPCISRVVPLDRAPTALADWAADPGGVLRIQVTMS